MNEFGFSQHEEEMPPPKSQKTGTWSLQISPAENGYFLTVAEVGMKQRVEFVFATLDELLDHIMARYGNVQ